MTMVSVTYLVKTSALQALQAAHIAGHLRIGRGAPQTQTVTKIFAQFVAHCVTVWLRIS